MRPLFASLCLLAACGSPAALPDGGLDATVDPTRDAGSPSLDGASPDAQTAHLDGGSPCVVSGTPGTCLHVDDCAGGRVSTPGFCPGPAEIQCCTAAPDGGDAGDGGDGGPSCDPEVMPTPNEGLVEEPGAPGCPAGMTRVADFCVDRFEASLVLVDDRGPIGSWSPFHNPGARRVRALSMREAIPQGYITGVQAEAACLEAGKRLCTDAEWLRACRGAEGRTYPYGDARMSGECNDARARHPAVERFGTSDDWIWSRLDDACINQLPDSLAPTGSHPGCVTPEGVMDMMGNLHEWTADPAGTFRGGFYVDTVRNGDGCLYRTTAHDRGHWDYSTGFRCCADPG